MRIPHMIKLMRPHQYIKNLFIFLPLFFDARIMETPLLINAIIAFFAFSLTASAIYTFNDYLDIEEDRQHPRKKDRPLASGVVSKPQAIITMALLFMAGFTLMASLSSGAATILLAYIIMNIAYCIKLKHVAIVDVTVIAIGFVLRLFIGSVVTNTSLSMWIVIMTFLLALFMALAKRRDDVLIYLDTGKKMRKVIDGYNLQFLDSSMTIMASVVIVAYTLYTTSTEVVARVNSEYLYITALYVLLGIIRYMQITFVEKGSSSPSNILLKDHFIQLTLIAWIITFAWILY